ncbi:MAG: FtsQ-type POTRA domain-containing protein [Deltaproteobacteria bacterium]|nr:FtsQ-type POTRA domain-containing protein [Deltaproteobacteria bacterium]
MGTTVRRANRRKKDNALKTDRWKVRREDAARALSRLRLVIAPALLIVVLAVAYHLVMSSGLFKVTRMTMNACDHVSLEEIDRVVNLYPGENILRVDLDRLRRRILSHPWIADVTVRREFPGTIRIQARERRPLASIMLDAKGGAAVLGPDDRQRIDNLYYVDDEGVIFKKVAAGENLDLPLLRGFHKDRFTDPAARTEQAAKRLRDAVRLLTDAETRAGIDLARIDEVVYTPGKGFSLFIDNARTQIRLGPPPFGDALGRLSLVMDRLGAQARLVSRIDLTHPERTIVQGLREKGTT